MGVSKSVGFGPGAAGVLGTTGLVLALVVASVGCQGRDKVRTVDGGPMMFSIPANRDLDLLFLIDDSVATGVQQRKFREQIPALLNLLSELPGGLPNLHVAVVSSSLGAGAFTNVTGCQPGTIGNRGGAFQHDAACTALPPTANFIKSIAGQNNFTGNLADVIGCITNLGEGGCGFEHQFEATRSALQRAQDPLDPDNAGFLRANAVLAIVMLTNEDDCSVPFDSTLLDPSQQKLADPLGGFTSYRCNDFGHRCDQPLPHDVTDLPMTLTNCRSAEDGKLVTVDSFVKFLRSLKANPDEQIVVAALAGPVAPYTVGSHVFTLGDGTQEAQPWIEHSCTEASFGGQDPQYADPPIRIKQWLDAFGHYGVLRSVCRPDFHDWMMHIAGAIGVQLYGTMCLSGTVAPKVDGTPDCVVVETTRDVAGTPTDVTLPFCADGRPVVPCWEILADPRCSTAQKRFRVCRDTACFGIAESVRSVELSCKFVR